MRLPEQQVQALDRLAADSGRHKQQVVSELLGERLEVGRIDLPHPPAEGEEVLTLAEAAELLRVAPEALERTIGRGGPPARGIDGELRLLRAAVLDWLAGAEPPTPRL